MAFLSPFFLPQVGEGSRRRWGTEEMTKTPSHTGLGEGREEAFTERAVILVVVVSPDRGSTPLCSLQGEQPERAREGGGRREFLNGQTDATSPSPGLRPPPPARGGRSRREAVQRLGPASPLSSSQKPGEWPFRRALAPSDRRAGWDVIPWHQPRAPCFAHQRMEERRAQKSQKGTADERRRGRPTGVGRGCGGVVGRGGSPLLPPARPGR